MQLLFFFTGLLKHASSSSLLVTYRINSMKRRIENAKNQWTRRSLINEIRYLTFTKYNSSELEGLYANNYRIKNLLNWCVFGQTFLRS